ncbi:MAG: membrane protein insertase YidC, partial [Steroidobacteraceae bacterium]|nr:membrane protein insertase YidC [Steroidobacteraceae bacterium]
MTNNIRVFLWLAVALALYINYTQWQLDFAPKPATAAVAGAGTDVNGAPKQQSLDDNVPQVTQPADAPTADAAPTVAAAIPSPASESTASSQVVRVVTDVLSIDIDLRGGTLVRAELPGYPVKKGQPEAVVLFNHDDPATNYEVQSGLAGVQAENSPTHRAMFSSEAAKYTLGPGQQELRVPLTWTDGQGVTVSKTFVFHRSMFSIGLEYAIDNKSSAPWSFASYTRLSRNDPEVERSMFVVESFATRGPAIWDPNGKKYQKLDIEKSENQNLSLSVTGGWLAGIQHHFVGAIVPDQKKPHTYTLQAQGRQYILGAKGEVTTIAPGKTATIKEQLFVGPKLQRQLDSLHEELSRVADYGILTPLSKPLFLLLDYIHGVVKNWGVAIILATFLLKLLFYPLSEKAGRSMAKMRELTPRMKALQETYKDDRSKLGQATMDLYRTEKVNPLAGCLPMIIQMPVFLAFYWVLLESVEMRQAPFMLWITDLSSRDPFFILPALNGLA